METTANTKGVTVLELVVIIATILIILAVTPTLIAKIKVKINDARRLHHVEELRTALQIYYRYNGNYPSAPNPEKITGKDTVSETLKQSFLVLGTRLPIDPASPTYDYTYQSHSSSKSYTITYCLEAYTDATHTADCANTAVPKPLIWN